jgi:hypothetical protein
MYFHCPDQPFEAEAQLYLEFSPYLKENNTLHHYTDKFINSV